MKNIENILDNNYLKLEYLDAEVIVDNEDPDDAARLALEVWNDVKDNDIDNNDVGGSLWPQIQAKILEVVRDPDVQLEVREIIWEEYIPTLEIVGGYNNMNCPHKEDCNECTDEECLHGCHDCGYFDGGNCIHSGCSHIGCLGGECACDCSEWNDGRY